MHFSAPIRSVEKYLGIVVCFFFSLIHALAPRSKDKRLKNILFIELVEMGAATMAYSSLRYVRKQIPDARIHVLCLESKKDSWLLLDEIEAVHVIHDKSFGTLVPSIFKQVRVLSKIRFDLIIDLDLFLRISAIIAFLIRAKFRAGFFRYNMEGLYRGTFYDIKCSFNQNMHIAKNFLALTKSAVTLSERYYNYDGPISDDEIFTPHYEPDRNIAELVSRAVGAPPYILVAPTVGHALPMRDYPKEHYVAVIKKLSALYPEKKIVLIGTKEHRPVCDFIAQRSRCINYAGQTKSFSELMALLSLGDLLISNDSGNPHFAAMVGLPTLAIFGPETPFMYGPLGKAVCLYKFFQSMPSITAYNHKNPVEESTEALSNITPDEIVKMAQVILNGEAKFGTVNNETFYI